LSPNAGPVFITGGSGFVGRAVVRHAVEVRSGVRALARTDEAAATVSRLGAEPVRATLDSEAALAAGMRGCSSVLHVAGISEICPRDAAEMDRVNIDGPATVVRAAARAGIGRVVHTSSAATVGEHQGEIGRDDTVHRGTFLSRYERSKLLGERRAFEAGREHGVDVVSVNPSSVHGPGRTTGSAKLLIRAARSRVALLVRTWISVVDVDDCARAHLLAEERGRAGQRYVVSAASLPLCRAVEVLRDVAGRPRHVVWLPRSMVEAVVPLARTAANLWPGGRVCPAMIETLLHGHRYDGSRAAEQLGFSYTPPHETLGRTVAWYADRGLLRSAPA